MLKHILEPARRAGQRRFVARAGDVHTQMGLQDVMLRGGEKVREIRRPAGDVVVELAAWL